jgi:hypothetical protein
MEPLITEPANKSPIERSTADPSAAMLSNAKALLPSVAWRVITNIGQGVTQYDWVSRNYIGGMVYSVVLLCVHCGLFYLITFPFFDKCI